MKDNKGFGIIEIILALMIFIIVAHVFKRAWIEMVEELMNGI